MHYNLAGLAHLNAGVTLSFSLHDSFLPLSMFWCCWATRNPPHTSAPKTHQRGDPSPPPTPMSIVIAWFAGTFWALALVKSALTNAAHYCFRVSARQPCCCVEERSGSHCLQDANLTRFHTDGDHILPPIYGAANDCFCWPASFVSTEYEGLRGIESQQ